MRVRLVIAGVITLWLATKIGLAALFVLAGVGVGWYIRDVKKHRMVRCRVCSGGGDEKSLISGKWLRTPFGDCWCCGGRKAHPRLALRVIAPAEHKRITEEIRRAKERR